MKDLSSFSNHLVDLFHYTRWANRKVLAALEDLPASDERQRPRALLSHLLRAEAIWLARVRDAEQVPALWEMDALSVCSERLEENARQWLSLLRKREPGRVVRYENSKGKTFENELREIASHVVNHSTHHRAQIAALVREANHEPPATDYVFYAR